jgi:hypothetical protein
MAGDEGKQVAPHPVEDEMFFVRGGDIIPNPSDSEP